MGASNLGWLELCDLAVKGHQASNIKSVAVLYPLLCTLCKRRIEQCLGQESEAGI